jgi:hypothetical protein
MAPLLTAENAVRRMAAECAYVDERGGVRSEPVPRSQSRTMGNPAERLAERRRAG